MNPAAVGQSFQQGLELGQQRRGEMESRNALSALAANPNDADAMRNLAFYNPQAAQRQQVINQRERAAQQEAQQKSMTAELVRAAMAGDEAALDELAVVNRAAWKDINSDQQEQIVRESETLGQAALDILQVPFEQRQGRIIQYAQQFPQYAEQINELALLPQEHQDLALRGVVIDARMVGKLHQMERPRYQAIPSGGTLVDTSNPQAVRQFQSEVQGGYTEGQTATNPQTGERLVFRNGSWRPM